MDVVAPLPAHGQAAELEEPGDGPLGDPSEPAELLARLDPLAGDPVEDAADLQIGMAARDVVGLVGMELLRADPWTATRPLDRFDHFDDRLEERAVVVVRVGVPGAQRDAVAVD
jgi:hypothetical protein